jgi:hypothetical protein
MNENCKKSCGRCSGDPCRDDNNYCQYWADNGECTINPDYMKVNCKKACNNCNNNVEEQLQGTTHLAPAQAPKIKISPVSAPRIKGVKDLNARIKKSEK